MKELIEKLTGFQNLIENEGLSMENMDAFVDASKELYERVIILRYKAYEQNVFGVRNEPKVIVSNEENTDIPNEIPSIDFSLFNESTLTSGEAEAELEENDKMIEEEEIFEAQNLDSTIEVTNTLTDEPSNETAVEINDESIDQDELIMEEMDAALEVNEEPFKEEATTTIDDQPFQNHFGLGKLDTLIGSFGLNERLQYINELFDGSSEAFSDGIKKLDQQENYASAREILVQYAKTYAWEKDSETVIEFAQKVARRYA